MPPEVSYQKFLQYSQENIWRDSNTDIFSKYWENSKKPILKNPYTCFWRDFRKWLIRTFFLESRFQNYPVLAVLLKNQLLSNGDCL